jgi:D-ribose pyranase
MLKDGLLNPQLLSLLSRVRHTNTLVIADYAFPFWPQVETVDLALVKGVPTVRQVLDAILPVWQCGTIRMAGEFRDHNSPEAIDAFQKTCRGVPLLFEPHSELKLRVPNAIGLIRTGDDTIYANMILESV